MAVPFAAYAMPAPRRQRTDPKSVIIKAGPLAIRTAPPTKSATARTASTGYTVQGRAASGRTGDMSESRKRGTPTPQAAKLIVDNEL